MVKNNIHDDNVCVTLLCRPSVSRPLPAGAWWVESGCQVDSGHLAALHELVASFALLHSLKATEGSSTFR